MCGIFGLITKNDISIGNVVLKGIKRLEYRGYDSCGIVALSNSKLYINKESGKIDNIFSPITFTTPLQIIAYYTSLYHGLDPDKPLNLSKTVTVH